MHKFFVEENQIKNDNIKILGLDVNHISKSLRLNEGDLILVSSNNKNYKCNIKSIKDEEINCKIIEELNDDNEPNIDIILFQGLAKGSKMDFIIQKGTEIGIKEFYGVEMDRSVVRVKNNKWKKNRLERYNKISEEAAKQCKRDYIPKFKDIISSKEMIETLRGRENIIVPYETEGNNNIGKVLNETKSDSIVLVIGPEGGFSIEEIELIKNIGGKTVSLGSRILRTETAALVASTIILYELQDIGVI